jgi:hypothetical protein
LIQANPTTSTPETAQILQSRDGVEPAAKALPDTFWRAWSWWLPPALGGLALVIYFLDPFIGDWDGLEYTMYSLWGYPSSMALGRNLFIFGNHLLWVIAHSLFNIGPEQAYLIFKFAVVAQAPLAVIACWVLARDFTRSLYAATVAALFVAFSPVFVIYGGQVMTDVPSVLLVAVALIVHFRGLQQHSISKVLIGAALLGLGVNLRETVGFYLPWLVLAPFVCGWKFRRRELFYVGLSCAVFFLLAGAWFSYWFLTDPHYRYVWSGWRESMREESTRHPVAISNLKPYLMYFGISAPLVFLTIPFAPIREWALRRLSPLLLLWLVGLLANVLLFFNYSTTVNWRYFLTGLPALSPLAADYLIRALTQKYGSVSFAFRCCVGVILVVALAFGVYMKPISREFVEKRAMTRDYRHVLLKLPRDAVMISGAQTIAVKYWAGIGSGDWSAIGTGGGWLGNKLVPTIQEHLDEGDRVFLDADPRWWSPCGWQRDEIPTIVDLENRFGFRRATGTVYELRPLGEASARDVANLKLLLPENRPDDLKRCPPGRG